jgi:type IV pilus assembly protein PilB
MKGRIGDILVEMGFIGRDQLETAVMESKKTRALLGDVLLRLDWVTQEQLQMALAVQSGAQVLDTAQAELEIDEELIRQIPQNFINSHGVFPFARDNGTIKVATANPFDVLARDQLARMTGCRIADYVAPKEWISNAIELYYKTALTIDTDIERISHGDTGDGTFEENQIVNLASLLIEKGRLLGASDIHVVPDVNLVRIYYRIDGVLQQRNLFPKRFHQSLTSRYKIMGDIDISNPNIPHDGRIKYRGSSGEIDIRVSTFPTHLGETTVMRLLTFSGVVGNLRGLGFEEQDHARLQESLDQPYGLILVTGPTGSGKTTTLYCGLMEVNNPSVSVMTIEDPIEYMIPTIRQTAVNPKAGLTFANALRATLRQDPDIILVGEIRDQETAELALRATNTGHLVLSTLHTNDAASAINRLLDLGVSASMLASSLSIIVAQRLLRKICTRCAVPRPIRDEERQAFAGNKIEAPAEVLQPQGCDYCHNTGYRGRTGIYEVLRVNREIEQMIYKGALTSQIEDASVAAGTLLLKHQSLQKVTQQVTSMEEAFRVVAHG